MFEKSHAKKTGQSKTRILDGKVLSAVNLVAIGFSLFYIYTCAFGLISSQLHRGAYLLFTFPLCLMLYPIRRGTGGTRVPLIDWALLLTTLVAIGYWLIEYPSYAYRIGDPQSMDIIMGAVVVLLSLEAARRVVGWVLPLLAVICLLYA